MIPIAVLDACVLYPSPLRDFLVRAAIEELFLGRWSERILDETFRSIGRHQPDIDPTRLRRTRSLMCAAVLDCLVEGHEDLEGAILLPDPDDRHVVAAAVKAGAGLIVTFNLRDFPDAELARHGLTALHPDLFASELFMRRPAAVVDVLRTHASSSNSGRPGSRNSGRSAPEAP